MHRLIQTLTVIATILVALPFHSLSAQNSIIPRPAEMSQQDGEFEITRADLYSGGGWLGDERSSAGRFNGVGDRT